TILTLAEQQRTEEAIRTLNRELEKTVTERTSDLTEQRAYLTALVRHSPVAIVTCDRRSQIQMCNPAFERLFLYRQEEVAGRTLDDVLVPFEADTEAPGLTSGAIEGKDFHATGRRLRKDG